MSTFTRRTLLVALLAFVLTVIFFWVGAYPSLQAAFAPDRPFDEAPARTLADAQDRWQRVTCQPGQSDEALARLYRSHLLRDIPFFLANGVLCGAMLMLALGPGRSRKVVALALTLPLFAVAADSVENGALACWFFGAGATETSVRIAYLATRCKFCAFGGMLLIFLAGVLARGVRRWRGVGAS